MSLILITGGAGFIGSRVVPMLLACGHSVRVLDCLSPQVHGAVPSPANLAFLTAPNCEFLRGSVCVKEELRSALQGVETVIHLAAETGTAQSMYQVARYNDVNVMGTANLLDVLANDGNRSVKRIVLASSRSCTARAHMNALVARHPNGFSRRLEILPSLRPGNGSIGV